LALIRIFGSEAVRQNIGNVVSGGKRALEYAIAKVLIEMKQRTVAVISAGDQFGEQALFRNIRRSAWVRTLDPCHFATINATDFRTILAMVLKKRIE
jgi:CRP-like cAMP-binding protein